MKARAALRFLLLLYSGWVNRHQQSVIEYLRVENGVLREQLGGKRLRLTDDQRRRLAVRGKALGRKVLGDVACIVTPDTILRWYRRLIAQKYDGSRRRGPGRPRRSAEIEHLVVRMANENRRWGYTRIRDAMHSLGYVVSRSTVKRILEEYGTEPAPERRRRTDWKSFLKAHWEGLAATDFFTVEVLTLFGLVRYHVLFVIELATRRVEIAGISNGPYGEWMKQMARNLTDAESGFLRDKRFLIHDRDPLFTEAFARTLRAVGVKTARLPAKSPNLNAYAERFVRSAKEECLDRVVFLGERHLRAVLRDYSVHYHDERVHQGLGGQYPSGRDVRGDDIGALRRHERLGGMLSYYYREAA